MANDHTQFDWSLFVGNSLVHFEISLRDLLFWIDVEKKKRNKSLYHLNVDWKWIVNRLICVMCVQCGVYRLYKLCQNLFAKPKRLLLFHFIFFFLFFSFLFIIYPYMIITYSLYLTNHVIWTSNEIYFFFFTSITYYIRFISLSPKNRCIHFYKELDYCQLCDNFLFSLAICLLFFLSSLIYFIKMFTFQWVYLREQEKKKKKEEKYSPEWKCIVDKMPFPIDISVHVCWNKCCEQCFFW